MKLFKNYISKRKLREENIRLNALLNQPVQINTVERGVQPYLVRFNMLDGMPIDMAKREASYKIAEGLLNSNFIEWDIEDNDWNPYSFKTLVGKIYIAIK